MKVFFVGVDRSVQKLLEKAEVLRVLDSSFCLDKLQAAIQSIETLESKPVVND